jgi:hypothetical protein
MAFLIMAFLDGMMILMVNKIGEEEVLFLDTKRLRF